LTNVSYKLCMITSSWQQPSLLGQQRQQELMNRVCSIWELAFSFLLWSICRTCFHIFHMCVCLDDQPCMYLVKVNKYLDHMLMFIINNLFWQSWHLPAGHFSHSIFSLEIFPVLSTLKYSRRALGLFLCLWPIFLGFV